MFFEKDNTSDKGKNGFKWKDTDEGDDFWDDVIIEENFDLFFEKYPKSNRAKLEKDKYYKSNETNENWYIIKVKSTTCTTIPDGYVATAFCINSKGMYLSKCYVENKNWQPASQQDIDWLNQCIAANKYVEMKQHEYEVVHCETQEQWDFVTEKLNYKWNGSNEYMWNLKKKKSCILLNENKQDSLDFFKSQNSKIYSFQDWCVKFNHQFEEFKVGDWVIGNNGFLPEKAQKIIKNRKR